MLTSEAVGGYVASIRGVRAVMASTVRTLWADVPDDPVEARNTLLPAAVALVATFGDLVSLAASDFYGEVTPSTGFVPLFAAPASSTQVEASIRWAVGPLFQSEPDRAAALGRVESVVERISVNQGHETIYQSGVADPGRPRFARVPVGDTCAWCRLMSSRGAVYRSEASAKFRRSHTKCDCKVVPVFDGDDLPYDRQALLDEYEAARREADTGSIKSVSAAMRANTANS